MTSVLPPKATTPKRKKEKERDKDKDKNDRSLTSGPVERLKTVVRRLPANLPEDVFWNSVQTWVSDETVTWKSFFSGKLRKKLNKENISSRAYIAFKTEEQLALFSKEYDGHLFRDKAGNESQAIVEFAPYQKVVTERKKVDSRNATIEKDEDYISFLQSLQPSSSTLEPVSLETLIAANQPPPPPKTTPLLEALKAEKAAIKEREAAIRIQTNSAAAARRAEALKRDTKPVEPALGKKAAKKAAAAAAETTASNKPGTSGQKDVVQPKTIISPVPTGPKAQRLARKQPQAKAAAGPPAAAPVTVLTSAAAGPSAASASPAPPPPAVVPPARRTRPVIGIGRQFEAALSGAGVSAAERKTRREREKEKEKEKAKEIGDKPKDQLPDPPTSPKKDRGGRRKDSISAAPPVQVPSILQRQDAPQTSTETGPPPPDPGPVNGPGRGGFRRGRGRGRGGGGIGAPRGG